MSRIGKQAIELPKGVTVSLDKGDVTVKGPKGELTQAIYPSLTIEQTNGTLQVSRPNDERESRARHGLARSLIANMVEGVSNGHQKALEVHGVGYRAQSQNNNLRLSVGYSHEVVIQAPKGIEIEVVEEGKSATKIFVRGIDKQKVGQIAADIRKVRKPDKYKGKGIRYVGEVVKLKPGKRAAAA